MLVSLSLALVLGTALPLPPPQAALPAVAPSLAESGSPEPTKEEKTQGIVKTLVIVTVGLAFLFLGGFAIWRLRKYLKEEEIL
ncbi:MAG: hypothetical protein HY720_16540 [Planctomycetes bacterium]|nr:hypothetical protein [Planctomycetota bacterium]